MDNSENRLICSQTIFLVRIPFIGYVKSSATVSFRSLVSTRPLARQEKRYVVVL